MSNDPNDQSNGKLTGNNQPAFEADIMQLLAMILEARRNNPNARQVSNETKKPATQPPLPPPPPGFN